MKILTYNILNPYHAVKWKTAEGLDHKEEDNWFAWRAEAILNNLKEACFDVLCLQEVSTENAHWLSRSFHLASHALHETDEPLGAHGTAVFYNPNTVELIASYQLDSEDRPQRIAAAADFRDLNSGRLLRCISVHLKGYNPYEKDLALKRAAQQTGDHELLNYLSQQRSLPKEPDGTAILGDFNEDEKEMCRSDSRQQILLDDGYIWDQKIDCTETRTGRKIDWAFYKALSVQGKAKVSHARPAQRLEASDHALTGFQLEFES